jgi:N-acetyl-anhydromuramyl-L-alanine amidase AmpD
MTPVPAPYKGIVNEVIQAPDCKLKGPSPWVGIIIHHTGVGPRRLQDLNESMWRKLFKGITGWLSKSDENYVSAHFHIGRYGECVMLADPDRYIAYHAGASSFYHPLERRVIPGWNSYAIGIELLGDGNQNDFSDEQYIVLTKLCSALMVRFQTIDPRCVTGHENIAPDRKVDPGKCFNWRKFNFMLWRELARMSH